MSVRSKPHLHSEGQTEQPEPCGAEGRLRHMHLEMDAEIAWRDRSDNIICLWLCHMNATTKIKAVWAPTPTSKLPALHTNSLRCLCSGDSPAHNNKRGVSCAVSHGRMGPDPSSQAGAIERPQLARGCCTRCILTLERGRTRRHDKSAKAGAGAEQEWATSCPLLQAQTQGKSRL